MISVQAEIKQATKHLNSVQKRQIPFAVASTLTELAMQLARKEMPELTRKTFQGGATSFTQKAFLYGKATKATLTSRVYAKAKQGEYLHFQVSGGSRFPNRKAIIVPTNNTRLNKLGNITRGTMDKMFQDKSKYFRGKPKGMPDAGEGVWERYGRQSKRGGQRIRMVAAFRGNAQYKPLFPFAEHAGKVVFGRSGFSFYFSKKLDQALRTAK